MSLTSSTTDGESKVYLIPGTELNLIASSADMVFVDILNLLCDDAPRCDLHDSESRSLISVDGGHLTQSGAQRLSERLPLVVTNPSVIE